MDVEGMAAAMLKAPVEGIASLSVFIYKWLLPVYSYIAVSVSLPLFHTSLVNSRLAMIILPPQ